MKRFNKLLVIFLNVLILFSLCIPKTTLQAEAIANDRPVVEEIMIDKNLVNPKERINMEVKFTGDLSEKNFIVVTYKEKNDLDPNKIKINFKQKTVNHFVGDFSFGQYNISGEWEIERIFVGDYDVLSGSFYYPEDLKHLNLETSKIILENSTPDITGPELISLTIDKTKVKVGDTINLTVKATDNLSGVDKVSVKYSSFDSNDDSVFSGKSIHFKRVGDEYHGQLLITEDMTKGTWHISYLYLTDFAKNYLFYRYNHQENSFIANSQFEILAEHDIVPLEAYTVLESKELRDMVIKGDLYIGPNAVANIRGDVMVEGNIYVLGAMDVRGNLSIKESLHARTVNWGYSSNYYNGSVVLRSGNMSIPSIIASNQAFDIPHTIYQANSSNIEVYDGQLSITGAYVPVVDLYIDNELITAQEDGTFQLEKDASKQKSIKIKTVDVYNNEKIHTYFIDHKSLDPNAKHIENISLDISQKTIHVDDVITIPVTISPGEAFNKNLLWESNNNIVATVDDLGQIKGISDGFADITVTSVQGGHQAFLRIIVEDIVSARKEASEELRNYVSPDDYLANEAFLLKEISSGEEAINLSATKKDVAEALLSAKQAIDLIESDDKIMVRELREAKDKAKLDLSTYVDRSLYTINQEILMQTISDGDNNIEQALDIGSLKGIVSNTKALIDKIKTDQGLLQDSKANSLLALESYVSSVNYTTNLKELEKAQSDGKAAIELSTTIEQVEAALAAAQLEIDNIESDAILMDANQAVDKAEKNLLISEIEIAKEKVFALKETELKRSLLDRLEIAESQVKVGWYKNDGMWTYYDSNGALETGWTKVDNKWYYMNNSGHMQTGWVQAGGNWFYMNASGHMQTGWVQVGANWFYMNASGHMQTGWVQAGGNWFYMNASGHMQTGWVQAGGNWFYMNASGHMQTGWTQVTNYWYYMNSSGHMQTGWVKAGGNWFYMNASGHMQTGWTQVTNYWYYMNSSGHMQTGWLKLGNNWYYLNDNGRMQTQNKTINGKYYRFSSSGRML